MWSRFQTHEVRELSWIFEGPGLLSDQCFPSEIESDSTLTSLITPFANALESLDRHPEPLLKFLAELETHGRLGRYFEHLLRYFLMEFARVDRLESNIQVRDGGITRGELDLVYLLANHSRPKHWEASVKFYLCTAESDAEARETRFFMGTLVFDRFDRKLDKLLHRQLLLPQTECGRLELERRGFRDPESRALLKGWLFYPSHRDWCRHVHPLEVSPSHIHGWWTTNDRLVFPRQGSDGLYMEIPPKRWLAPFVGPAPITPLMTEAALIDHVREYFGGPRTPRIAYREMMVAEVERIPNPFGGEPWVREVCRGHILHEDWPALARSSAAEPLDGSKQGQKV